MPWQGGPQETGNKQRQVLSQALLLRKLTCKILMVREGRLPLWPRLGTAFARTVSVEGALIWEGWRCSGPRIRGQMADPGPPQPSQGQASWGSAWLIQPQSSGKGRRLAGSGTTPSPSHHKELLLVA